LRWTKSTSQLTQKLFFAFAHGTAREEDYRGGDDNARIHKIYKIDDLEGAYSCRLKASIRRNLTKAEVEMLLKGYPPWYRETIPTEYGFNIWSPIHSEVDLRRGGWVLAIGMSKIEPMPIYVDPGSERITRPYVQATNRVLQVLRETFLPSFQKILS
jgi:hypothetical protein